MKKQLKRMTKRSLRERLEGSRSKRYRTRFKPRRKKTSLQSRATGKLKGWLRRRIKRLFD